MNPLRILHVIDHFYPLLGYQETFLAKAHGKNNKVLVITSDRYSKSLYLSNKNLLKNKVLAPGNYREEGVKVLRLPTLFDGAPFYTPWLMNLEKAVINFKPDIIIVHGIVSITSIRIVGLKSKIQNTKIIFDDHMTYNATRGSWTNILYKIFKHIRTPILLRTGDAFVAVTNETKNFMFEKYGIPKDKIIIIPLGIDRSRFYFDSNSRNSIRVKYKINNDDIVFIYAGKITPLKGIHILIDAASQLCKNNSNLKFLFVGGRDNNYFYELKRNISKMGLDNYYIFIDTVPNFELYKYFSAADIGIWPMQCSIAMLEATACGLPTIISDKSGAQERVAYGNGLLYKESDVNDLLFKMKSLLNKDLRKKMSILSLEYVKNLDWDNLSEKFLDIINS